MSVPTEKLFATAVFDFVAPDAHLHLSFYEGDTIAVTLQQGPSQWWKGYVVGSEENGVVYEGIFPGSYVKLLRAAPAAAIAPSPKPRSATAAGAPPTKKPDDRPSPHRIACTTRFGPWGHYMALFACAVMALVGIGNLIVRDLGNVGGEGTLMLTGIVTFLSTVPILLYEFSYGVARLSPSSLPLPAVPYLLLAAFPLFSRITLFGGACLLLSGFAYLLSWRNNETWDLRKNQRQSPYQEDTKADGVLEWILLKRREGKLGHIVFLAAYTLTNVVLFFSTLGDWISKTENPDFVAISVERFGQSPSNSLPWAKAFAQVLNFNCAIILVPVARTFIRSLYNRSTRSDGSISTIVLRKVLQLIPIDNALDFHKLCAAVIFVATVGHVLAHIANYGKTPSLVRQQFQEWVWVTGLLILSAMCAMYGSAMPYVRHGHFELFWYTHHLFLVFYVMLLLHGEGGTAPAFWRWLLVPGALYLLERVLRSYRARQEVIVRSVTRMPPNVMCLEVECPFRDGYKEGQFAFLKAAHVSRSEWHPFTISSAPQDNTMTFHIRVQGEGSWTRQLRDYFALLGVGRERIMFTRQTSKGIVAGKVVGPDGKPLIQIDGPHAAPTQHVGEYRSVILVGAGIGLTPMCSTLRSIILHRWHKGYNPTRLVFVWVCKHADVRPFQWFIHVLKELDDEVYHRRNVLPDFDTQYHVEFHVYVTSVPKEQNRVSPGVIEPAESFDVWNRGQQRVSRAVEAPFTAQDLWQAMMDPGVHGQLGDVHIWNGRPQWHERFQTTRAGTPNGENVGVAFCGPSVIGADLGSLCARYSDENERKFFKFHTENF